MIVGVMILDAALSYAYATMVLLRGGSFGMAVLSFFGMGFAAFVIMTIGVVLHQLPGPKSQLHTDHDKDAVELA